MSPDGSKVQWSPSPFWAAGKDGVKLAEIKNVIKGLGGSHKAAIAGEMR